MLPLISLLHPTARVKPSGQFPRAWLAAHDVWLERADHPGRVEYILTVHESRWADFQVYGQYPSELWARFDVAMNSKRDCVVDQTNLAAATSTGSILMGVQDDFLPPLHWDTLIRESVPTQLRWELTGRVSRPVSGLDTQFIILCSAGAGRERDQELMIAGAESRARYEHNGYLLDPDFESMYSDNWRAIQARRDEAADLVTIVERFDIEFEHNHPAFGKGELDDVYRLQNRELAYRQGAAILQQKVTGAKVIVICLPGEVFRNEWVGTTFQMVQGLGSMGYITGPHWCYTSNVYCTRIELSHGALDFRPKADFVLWIDDDNLVTAEQVQMLIDDLEARPELGGVTGWCWCDHNQSDGNTLETWRMSVGRQRVSDLACMRFTTEDLQEAYTRSPLITSDDIAPDAFWSGFPCVLMRRSALEKLGPDAFAPMLRKVNYGFTGEDTSFFINAHEKGVKFGVDVRVKVPHVKWRAIEPAVVLGRPEKVALPSESSAAD